jgi:asparagine synthase (glutamine-hydrolysing)
MCGITGVFHRHQALAESGTRSMSAALAHRGPDDEGAETRRVPGGFLALGQRRLSILDLTPAGHQPMTNPSTGDGIVFNGEIYNFPALRRELAGAGACFGSRCDTEAILHAFARWGVDCFDRLHGMFALALYDRQRERLILARDPLGIKPLYYGLTDRAFAFASEVRALAASGLFDLDLDRRALAGFLAYGAVPQPLTLFREMRMLEPGTWIAVDLAHSAGRLSHSEPRRFWSFPAPQASTNYPDAVATVRTLLADAVRSHLLSDVPVAAFLSSGLDSTAIAALGADASDAIHTFTVGLEGHPNLDEAPVARETARQLGVAHTTIELTPGDALAYTRRYFASLDQPTVDGINTFIIAGAVRDRGYKVALSGLGGDELFGGYASFRQIPRLARWLPWARAIPARLRGVGADLLFRARSSTQRQKARELATTAPTLPDLYFRRRRLFSDRDLADFGLRSKELGLDTVFLPPESRPAEALTGLAPAAVIGVLETRFYLGNMLLRDCDVFGMAHGLEIRVPLLDRALLDYVYALPAQWRTPRGQQNKPLLADAMADRGRFAAIGRFPKRGFSLPQAAWMAGPLREDFEHHLGVLGDSGLLDPRTVQRVWRDFLADLNGPTWSRLWMLGGLGSWLARGA